MKHSSRIPYIDGLKGLCGIWVCLFHYLLAFAPFGYIGWESGIAPEMRSTEYFRWFPYSVLSNASFPLYVFFALIAFLPALRFFRTGNVESIRRQAVIRYFRLMPPVLACALCGWAVYASGGFFHQELGAALHNTWDKAMYPPPITFTGALYNGVYDAFFNGNGNYCSVLWCMKVILFGSYLSYAILLLFGHVRQSLLLYAALFLLTFYDPMYTAFVGGIVAARILAQDGDSSDGAWGGALVVAGLVIGNFPEVWLPAQLSLLTCYGVGAFLVLLGCARSAWVRTFLSHPVLVRAGELSFALVLAHFAILMSVSAWFFLWLQQQGVPYAVALLLTLLTAIPLNMAGAVLFQRWVEAPTERLTRWMYAKIQERIATNAAGLSH